MLDKTKIFVRGCKKTTNVLKQISEELHIQINGYDLSDLSEYCYGQSFLDYSPISIWCSYGDGSKYFLDQGYVEVTPEEFLGAWLGEEYPKQESKSEQFCCKGCEKLREVCQRLAEEGFIDPSKESFKTVSSEEFYFFKKDHKMWYFTTGNPRGEVVSPEEFYERIAGKPWEEKKKIFTGFLGDPDVNIEFLPTNQSFVKNSSENFLSLSEQKPLKIIL